MKATFAMLALSLALFTSCSTSEKVSFQEADNYFFRNDATIPNSLKITSQQQLESLFGMATTMGPNGRPTKVDFSRQFVLAKVLPVTDVHTTMRPLKVTHKDNKLFFSYEVKRGQKMSYSTQPMTMVIVDRKYVDCDVEAIEKVVNE
jgi:hypothetical protein